MNGATNGATRHLTPAQIRATHRLTEALLLARGEIGTRTTPPFSQPVYRVATHGAIEPVVVTTQRCDKGATTQEMRAE